MMLPTVTTGSEIGTNLARFGSRAGSLPAPAPMPGAALLFQLCAPWGRGMQLYGHSRAASPAAPWLLLLHWFIWVQGAWNVLFSEAFFSLCV